MVSKAPVTSEVHAPASKMAQSKVANKKEGAATGASSSANKAHQQPPQHNRLGNTSKSKGNRKKECSKQTSGVEKGAEAGVTPGDAPGDSGRTKCANMVINVYICIHDGSDSLNFLLIYLNLKLHYFLFNIPDLYSPFI